MKIDPLPIARLERVDSELAIIMLMDAVRALKKIANCDEQDCARYVAKVDAIAIDVLVSIEGMLP